MIRMPHRNVTRFFIPLIDVLILLFCIFLMMEFKSNSDATEQSEISSELADKVQEKDAELAKRARELRQVEEEKAAELEKLRDEFDAFKKLHPSETQLAQLQKELMQAKKELDRLKKANLQSLQQRSFFKIIDINRNDGTISFYDETRKIDPVIPIKSKEDAEKLIARQMQQAKQLNRSDLYYYFVRTRPTEEERKMGKTAIRWPVARQIREYKNWFSKAANNLAEYE